MNKYQEAFKRTKEVVTADTLDDFITLKELVEKATPNKPNYEAYGYSESELVYDTWICPSCRTRYEVDYDEYDYCHKCGQRLDWSKEE